MKVTIETGAQRFITIVKEKVMDATFTFVVIDDDDKLRIIPVRIEFSNRIVRL